MNKLTNKRILFLAAVIIFMLMIALNINVVWSGLKTVFVVITPITIGVCLAFILNLLNNLFEKHVFAKLSTANKPRKKLVRMLSVICSLLFAMAAIALVLLVIIPQVIDTVNSIVAGFPSFAKRAIQLGRELLERFGVSPKSITEFVLGGEAFFDKLITFANENVNGVVRSVVSIGGEVINGLSNLVFGIFVAVYLLADKERVLSQIRRFMRASLNSKVYNKTIHIGKVANRSFSNFISGQFLEAVILGTLCFIGMLIFSFPYAPVVAVLIGVTALIPIVGAWIGAGVSAFLILMVSPVKMLWFLVFYIILQQIETNFIYPKVVGKQVGLPGVWVLISVVIGTGLFGAFGALMAVPVTSVLYTLAAEFVVAFEKKQAVSDNERPVE